MECYDLFLLFSNLRIISFFLFYFIIFVLFIHLVYYVLFACLHMNIINIY